MLIQTTDHAVQQCFKVDNPVQWIVNGFQIALRDCAELNCEIVGIERFPGLAAQGRQGRAQLLSGAAALSAAASALAFPIPFGTGLNNGLPYSLDGEIERLTITIAL